VNAVPASVFDPLLLGSVSLKVLAAAQQTPERIAALQSQRLADLLSVVGRRSAFYAHVLKGRDPARVPLHELPVVTKSEMMSRFDEWVTDPRLTLPQLQAFTADRRRIGEPYLGRYLVWESSGSTGEPGIFVQDAQSLAIYDALEALRQSAPRPWQRLLDPLCITERIAFVGATTGHFASEVSAQRLRRLNRWLANSMRSFSILQPTAELVAELNRFKPTIVVGYPTAAAMLAEEYQRGALVARPREVWTGGETLTPSVRQFISRTFGCAVSNSYGASEFLPIGWECASGRMHANVDWVLLEPVDSTGRPVPAGRKSHSTLITHLGNTVQPIIRYDIGDQLRVHAQRCPCGSPFPVIEVEGRRDDPLHMRTVDGRLVTLLPLALSTVLEDEAHVFDFQIEQVDERTLLLRLSSSGAAATTEFGRCRDRLQSFARCHGLVPIEVISLPGEAPVQGRSGKVQRIIAAPREAHCERVDQISAAH
jgi:phenylacetate-coenzyme A ligase PaaK-like adenylate-forming protein